MMTPSSKLSRTVLRSASRSLSRTDALARTTARAFARSESPVDDIVFDNAASEAVRHMTAHEQLGFELGWDYAHYRVAPPATQLDERSPVRHGYEAGKAAFGQRTLAANAAVRRWLGIRLYAWTRGRSVELFQVTPHYLAQIDVTHCPITRELLDLSGSSPTSASIDRVRNDAGYAAGNLAVMSRRANQAKAGHDMREALTFAADIERAQAPSIAGLDAAEWKRLAVLSSFVEGLPHDQACRLPLLVLPPNRLRLFNPVQALQALVSQQLLAEGWSHRIVRIEDLLPGKPQRQAFHTFFHTLLPRVLEAGRYLEAHAQRVAVEDAWSNPLVLQRWVSFASQLTLAQCEDIVDRAGRRKLSNLCALSHTEAQAMDGWNVPTRGFVPHSMAGVGAGREAVQMSLPL
ncbi:MAG: hypothetical protein JWQ11_4836 [Rhizobacter sp.]|nr:hypothetical protein [Rhizobacter sp.]